MVGGSFSKPVLKRSPRVIGKDSLREHPEVVERFCNCCDLIWRTGLDAIAALSIGCPAKRQAMNFFTVRDPAGFGHKTIVRADPILDLLIGRRLMYHNVLYDTPFHQEDPVQSIHCLWHWLIASQGCESSLSCLPCFDHKNSNGVRGVNC